MRFEKWRATRAENRPEVVHAAWGLEGCRVCPSPPPSQYDWITKVVAVVPSDAVWEGYSAGDAGEADIHRGAKKVSRGRFIPLYPFEPAFEGMYRTNTERYERSRNQHPAETERAKIPIEKTRAQLLLLASDRDEVWASGTMARNLVERMMDDGQTQASVAQDLSDGWPYDCGRRHLPGSTVWRTVGRSKHEKLDG